MNIMKIVNFSKKKKMSKIRRFYGNYILADFVLTETSPVHVLCNFGTSFDAGSCSLLDACYYS